MIELFSGVPGSGKSLHTASFIKDCCIYHHPLIINFPINTELKYVKRAIDLGLLIILDNIEITPTKLVALSRYFLEKKSYKEDGIHLILDEAQLLFNSREWNINSNRMEWVSFFSQHRHFKYHIILVAQFDRMIDRQIRSLIEYEIKHLKVRNLGWRGLCLCLFVGFNAVMCVKSWYGENFHMGTNFIHIRRSLFKLYDTTYVFAAVAE